MKTLNEISKEVVGRHIAKALRQTRDSRAVAKNLGSSTDPHLKAVADRHSLRLSKRRRGLEKAFAKLAEETLNEISPAMRSDYVARAKVNKAGHAILADIKSRQAKEVLDNASKFASAYEKVGDVQKAEQMRQAGKTHHDKFKSLAQQYLNKADKRTRGIDIATSRLSEEVLTELSTKKTWQYIEKAQPDYNKTASDYKAKVAKMEVGDRVGEKGIQLHKKVMAKMSKRLKGLNTARAKVFNNKQFLESSEPLNELTKTTVARYVRKATKWNDTEAKHAGRAYAKAIGIRSTSALDRADKFSDKYSKRRRGINRALSILASGE